MVVVAASAAAAADDDDDERGAPLIDCRSIGGDTAPDGWQGNLNITYRTGPDTLQAHWYGDAVCSLYLPYEHQSSHFTVIAYQSEIIYEFIQSTNEQVARFTVTKLHTRS